MSLRDRLEAKDRRHVEVRVQVSDPDPDLRAAAAAQVFLLAAQADPGRAGELPALEQAHARALEAVGAHFADVAFDAMAPADFEALVDAHTDQDGIDRDGLLAALASECAVEADLRDEAWWAHQLRPDGLWTPGERDHLYYQLFTYLHYSVPSERLPKG